MNVKNVGKLSIRAQTLGDIIEFIVEKKLTYAMNAGNMLGKLRSY